MSGVVHGSKGKPLRHEVIAVGTSLGSSRIGAFYPVVPYFTGRIWGLEFSFVSRFKDMKISVRSRSLIDPSVEVIARDPVPVVSEKPVASI
jgi:hypothetical protein